MKKILVVDDDLDICALIQAYLGKEFKIFLANSAENGLKMILAEKPDLMLLDVIMPEISGYAFRRILKENEAKIVYVPVIVMSARESMKDHVDFLDRATFIKKPFTREQLLSAIHQFFEIKESSEKFSASTSKAGPAAEEAVPNAEKNASSVKKKHVVIASVDEDVIKILKELFSAKNYEIEIGLNEEDVVKQTARLQPDIVICQIWEDPTILDIPKIYKNLSEHPKTNRIPFIAISISALVLEASKQIKKEKIVSFNTMGELRAKIEALL